MNPVLILFGFGLIVWALTRKKPSLSVPETPAERAKRDPAVKRQIRAAVNLSRLTSPIAGVDDDTWRKFVQVFRSGGNSINPDYAMGAYLMTPDNLAEIGWMKNLRPYEWRGRTVKNGDWVKPPSQADYLTNEGVQYESFRIFMATMSGLIGSSLAPVIGKPLGDVEGAPVVTLSGLLAVAKRVGFGGVRRWLQDAEYRKNAAGVTGDFMLLNGMF